MDILRIDKSEKHDIQKMCAITNTQKLINKTVAFYHTQLYEDAEALTYLKDVLGIKDKRLIENFQVGYANGHLNKILPQKDEIINQLKELSLLTDDDSEYFLRCITMPVFDEQGNVSGIYGINIDKNEQYLIGSGAFNQLVFKTSSSIVGVETITDAFVLFQEGITGVTVLNDDSIEAMKRHHVKNVYVLNDTKIDDFNVFNLGLFDVKEYFAKNRKSDFEILMHQVNPGVDTTEPASFIEVLDSGVCVEFENRKYIVRGLEASSQKLRANIKAVDNHRFFIDTVDLYLSRARKNFAREVAILYGENQRIIENDLDQMIVQIEKYVQGKITNESRVSVKESDKEEAMEFLKSKNLIEGILKDFEELGCCGERTNKLMCYLAGVSRKLDDPLSLLVLSRSAAGKSTLQDTLLKMIPDEDKSKYTRITGQALFYKGEDSLKHKLIAIEEEEGAEQAAYSIRTMQSSKQLIIASTIKDPLTGEMKTQEYKVNGPLALMMTTTSNEIDYETMSRFVVLTIDESAEQTRLIHQMQREKDTLKGLLRGYQSDEIIRKHQNAQRLLKKIHVINPYAPNLTYMDNQLRARRDNKKYLNLIKAITFLHQHQREIKTIEHDGQKIEYVETTIDDIKLANLIAQEVLSRSLDELAPQSRNLLLETEKMVHAIAEKEKQHVFDVTFTRKDIRDYTKWSDYQVRTHLRQLVNLEYVLLVAGRNGSQMHYRLICQSTDNGNGSIVGLVNVTNLEGLKQ